ncbi:MAG: hypothetical protein A3D31_01875 [Candidatus Fluviicola riflensis]|nr:MAG: hypothetical protein CHH17_13160 [Candidatus Fluviicola riflensis]OGS78747.1 MAG: hypothetical protein A3D31_01875 [Candidatus Fluviicola riflensis]OGS86178.1 MAG: hypothetical protein A2724_01330 [Fluviicola sp. RIFCSPHIGHO2_01_FULL_43_53]OGS87709.1 MAG: hypothetical protein A3E30_16540 [Fluviicola sp. RIFCSPHIGHO2_12_FULL_43_24]
MDKHLNNNEERLFDLLDQKDFDQLTTEEKVFVETHFSQAEYRLQRQMIQESSTLYETVAEASPLVIPAGKSSFMGTTIPLYQALIGIAATIALFLSIWPDQNPPSGSQANKPALSKTDTIIQTRIIRDTVIRYKNHRNGNRSTQTNRSNDEQFLAAQMRLLEANTVELPDIINELNRPAGNSLRNDPASERLLKSTYQSDAR